MTKEEAIKILRREIECLSHTKCEDCILEAACDPIKTTPYDSEYIEVYEMAISALSAEPCREADDYENEIADLHNRLDIAEYDKERYKEEITTLEAENKGEWIPVSERLPEDYDRVLITVNGCRGLIVREARYYKAQNEFEVLHNHERWEVGEKGLLAWQPLPEPYKAEKGD